MELMAILGLENVFKSYYDNFGNPIEVLRNVNLNVSADAINTIIAPDKSGLTTLLRICSGLEPFTKGQLNKYTKDSIVYIPTEPSTFPWLNVYDNMRISEPKISPIEVRSRLFEVGLDGFEDYFPLESSNGFRFRLALARSLMNNPKLLIIDNSLKNIEPDSRFEIYDLLKKVKRNYNITILLGTSNITEALVLSDNIFLMSRIPGEIIEKMEVNYKSDRCVELLSNPEMHAMRNIILELFRQFRDHYKYTFTI